MEEQVENKSSVALDVILLRMALDNLQKSINSIFEQLSELRDELRKNKDGKP